MIIVIIHICVNIVLSYNCANNIGAKFQTANLVIFLQIRRKSPYYFIIYIVQASLREIARMTRIVVDIRKRSQEHTIFLDFFPSVASR